MIEIKHKDTGEVLHRVEAETLRNADLRGANLSGANLFRADLFRANLTGASLSSANLTRADLTRANLIKTDLSHASLMRADLFGAELNEANLGGADLTNAILTNANLIKADLTYTTLVEADLTDALIGFTYFTGCFVLHRAIGLQTCYHFNRSFLDAVTLRACTEHLPDVFLQGVGYSQEEIENLRGMYTRTFRFYSCFISYARTNDDFASRLHADLQSSNINCWKDTEDMRSGRHYRTQISDSIEQRNKLVLVCSQESVMRPAVIEEVAEAIRLEDETGDRKLFPIRLDNFVLSKEFETIAREKTATGEWPFNWLSRVKAYHIPDFSRWQEPDSYQRDFDKLLRDLKVEPTQAAGASS